MTDFPQLVKPIQSKRGKGWSVVYRDTGALVSRPDEIIYIKTQSGYRSRPAWNFYRLTPTLVCELHALKICAAKGLNVPEVLWFRREGEIVELAIANVTDGLPLNEYLKGNDSPEKKLVVIERVAAQIGRLHRSGWIHGALGNEHVLVQPDGKVTLIDFEKARWRPFAIGRDLARFWRRTECLDDPQAKRFNDAYYQWLKGNAAMEARG